MNNKYIYFFLIIFLLCLNIFLLLTNKKLKDKKSNNNIVPIEYEIKETNNVLLSEITGEQYESNGFFLNSDVTLISSDEEEVFLKDIINNSPKLLFDFKNISCKTCFEDEMERLLSLSDTLGKDNILFISKYNNIREQYVLEKKYNIKIYNIGENSLGLPIEKKYYPFICIVNANLEAKDFYIPTTIYYFLGETYYNEIYKKYFKK